MLQDPNRAWIRIFGSRRSKTLRNRLRAWQKFRSWLVALSGEVWPKSNVPLVAYVEERIDEGCTFSFPSELHASLTILEQIGRVPEDRRISSDHTWLAHLSSWKLELETNSRLPRPAKPYTVAILVSLEIFVMDSEQDLYCRFIAWVMLHWLSGFRKNEETTWGDGPSDVQGAMHIHTARQVVETIQMEVVNALTRGTAEVDETELLEEITQFADAHGVIGHRIRRRHTQQLERQLEPLQVLEHDSEDDQVLEIHENSNTDPVEQVETRPTDQGPKYFVTVSRRTGLRRLHAHFKCPVRSQRCLETFDLSTVDENSFDVMCRICKKRLQVDEGQQGSDSSSTSGDSSSTESETQRCQLWKQFHIHLLSLLIFCILVTGLAMAALDDNQKREFLQKNATSDLQYVWEDSEVSLETQYKLAQHYKSLRVFIALAESTAEVRNALRTDFQVDANAGAEQRAEAARVVSAWIFGKQLYEKETELHAESKVMGMPRNLQHSERQAMLKAVEGTLGPLSDQDTPSAEYLAVKVEECENGEISAATLDEVTSKAHKNTASLQTSLDSSGHVRVVKNKTKGSLPANTEEYRQSMKLEAISWLCMSAKFKSKHWLSDLKYDHFQKFIDFILGDRVNSIKVPMDNQQVSLKPSWALVLQYEHRLRREAVKLVNRGEKTLAEALTSVIKDPDLKEAFFTTPLALTASESPAKYQRTSHKGNHDSNNRFKGKGKNHQKGGNFHKGSFKGHKGGGKGKHGDLPLVSQTPDGRDICFAFNSQGCNGKCGRVHVCRVKGCFGDHAAREHSKFQSGQNKKE
eukprot:s612_g10.t1